MLDIDYYKYLSVDNGKGLLINKGDILIISRYGFDYKKYSSLRELILDIDNYINSSYEDMDDLEEVLIRFSDIDYYMSIKK